MRTTPWYRQSDKLAAFGVALLFVPFALYLIAAGIDVASWAFTGHEVFPWIGHALNGDGNQ